MTSRSTKHHTHHQHDDFVVIQADPDKGTPDRVTYLSKNQDGRQFEAVTSPNSVHAQKLAELAMLVQSNQRESREYKKPLAALGMSRPTAQIAAAAYQESAPRIQQVPYASDPQHQYQHQYQQYQDSFHSSNQYTVAPAQDQKHYVSDLRQQDLQYQAPEVYRYATEEHTAYTVKTRSGELMVSAPVGSSEGMAFDGVVQKISSKVGNP